MQGTWNNGKTALPVHVPQRIRGQEQGQPPDIGADPADKAEVCSRLGLTLTYHPQDKRVIAEARPATIMYVGKCPGPAHG
jgi:hypothetical protein